MGEDQGCFWEPTFNRSVKVHGVEESITSDAGVMLLREGDHRLGLTTDLARGMLDPRDPPHTRYTLTELLRERVYALALGYRTQDNLDRLAQDKVFRAAVWDRPGQRVGKERLGSQPTQSRLLDIVAGNKRNLEALREALPEWVLRHQRASGYDHGVQRGTIDLDSFPIEVRGRQEGSAYNGYYGATVYHPLVASFSPEGDYDACRLGEGFVHAILRKGNAASKAGAVRFLRHAWIKARKLARTLDVRFDAAFTVAEVMDPLTDDGIRFLGRLRNNAVLDRLAEPYLSRRPGRPPTEGYQYAVELGPHRAESWRHAQRLILVIVDRPDPKTGQLDLLPRYFFLVTNWRQEERSACDLLEHYRRRGTFEDRLGEFNACVGPALSSPTFRENEATLLLALLSHNLAGMLRGEMELATPTSGWDLGRLVGTVLKAGATVRQKGRRLIVELAEGVGAAWKLLLDRIQHWRLPSRWPAPPAPRPRPWVPPPAHAHLSLVLRL